ncbi:MAG TPA: phosphoribosylformylglycinamidine synthase subunit PurS [Longimicrobiales bacterium]
MTEYLVEVHVTPRVGLLDPQGKAVHHALHSLEFADVEDVRVGRLIRVKMKATSEDDARQRVDDMCKRLLANPVTEDYSISVGA